MRTRSKFKLVYIFFDKNINTLKKKEKKEKKRIIIKKENNELYNR